ncbi:MAG: TIGR01459 family HAD-type hydrolase [Pseudomonadota bacterium]
MHNGLSVFPEAVAALSAFRAKGGQVVLLTNAPRPQGEIAAQLAALGAPESCYDSIVTSGDAAQAGLAAGLVGHAVHHVGPDRDLSFFTDLPAGVRAERPIDRVPLRAAEGIVCTGLVDDETETPDDYRPLILEGVSRGLKMLCANPDIFVDRGDRRVWCAGGIAAAYAEAGGTVLYFGKPHAPIYALAQQRLAAASTDAPSKDRILCVGDGIGTDIAGGIGEGYDTLFVTGGLAAPAVGQTRERPDPTRLAGFLAQHGLSPTVAISMLR